MRLDKNIEWLVSLLREDLDDFRKKVIKDNDSSSDNIAIAILSGCIGILVAYISIQDNIVFDLSLILKFVWVILIFISLYFVMYKWLFKKYILLFIKKIKTRIWGKKNLAIQENEIILNKYYNMIISYILLAYNFYEHANNSKNEIQRLNYSESLYNITKSLLLLSENILKDKDIARNVIEYTKSVYNNIKKIPMYRIKETVAVIKSILESIRTSVEENEKWKITELNNSIEIFNEVCYAMKSYFDINIDDTLI